MRSALALSLIPVLAFSALTFAAPAVAAEPGAQVPVSTLYAELATASDSTATYDRTLFQHWVDADADGCDTREEVLIAESLVPATVGAGCAVSAGKWYSWYDGATWTIPSDVDIDHFVPLGEAWRAGAATWTADQRRSFANDLTLDVSLVGVTDNVNQSKGDRDPAQWMPPLANVACDYAVTWVTVKYRWNLSVDSGERTKLDSLLSGSCGSTPVTVPAKGGPAGQGGGAPANPGDTKNCSDFATWREAQDWYEIYFPYYGDVARLDSDSDGVVCVSLPGAP